MRDYLYIENIGKKIVDNLKSELDRVGLMYRVFYRVKTMDSMEKKIRTKGYGIGYNKLTDILGIRFTLYFKDDVIVVSDFLKRNKNFDHESSEKLLPQEFKPERLNLTFKFDEEQTKEILALLGSDSDKIATTYEVQLRTVLSEGWHEVEHDLRYKANEDWIGHEDLLRNLNGLFATLETSDFTMLKIFDTLSHRHYKNGNLSALLKTKFRLRLKSNKLDLGIIKLFEEKPHLLRKIIKLERDEYLERIFHSKVAVPLNLDNLVQIINEIYIDDEDLRKIAAPHIIEDIQIGLARN